MPYAIVAPRLDAEPADPAWGNAAVIPELSPTIGHGTRWAGSAPTRVMALWDDRGLCLRFVAFDGDAFAPFEGRDKPHNQGDVVEVFFDPVGDARTYYEIQISPLNQVLDKRFVAIGLIASDPEGVLVPESIASQKASLGFDIENLQSASRVLEDRWIVDLLIPADVIGALPKPGGEASMVYANFVRIDQPPRGHYDMVASRLSWSPTVRGRPHRSPQRMGALHLIPPP